MLHIGGLSPSMRKYLVKGERPPKAIRVIFSSPLSRFCLRLLSKCHSIVDKEDTAGIIWSQAAGCFPQSYRAPEIDSSNRLGCATRLSVWAADGPQPQRREPGEGRFPTRTPPWGLCIRPCGGSRGSSFCPGAPGTCFHPSGHLIGRA